MGDKYYKFVEIEVSPNLWKTPQWQQPHTYDPLNPYKVTCETKTS
jgi:hypothetical protein